MPIGRSALFAGCIAIIASPALADATDGRWCHPDGRHIGIAGPAVVTPGGTRMQGAYSRHDVTDVVPRTEPRAGATVAMTLANAMTVHLRHGAGAACTTEPGIEPWHRCGPPVSQRLDDAQGISRG